MTDQSTTVRVLLLTQAHCTFCDQARQLLGRLANEYPLTVSTMDLASPEGQALAEAHGVLFPPGIFLDGEAFSYGRPSERRLRREVDRRTRKVTQAAHTPS